MPTETVVTNVMSITNNFMTGFKLFVQDEPIVSGIVWPRAYG